MTAQEFSDSLAQVLKRASPGVVRVDGRRRYPLSGTVWDGERVVTTSRAVERDEDIRVMTEDGETHPATLIGRDPSTDLAVLRLTAGVGEAALSAPTWRGGDGLELGQLAFMVGRPRRELQASMGIVGAVGEPWRTAVGGRIARALWTDAKTFPGFSGGPLLTPSGAVLGINTAALTREGPTTVPTETVRRVVETLEAHGRMRRGYLGVAGQGVRLPDGLREAAGQGSGLLLTSVEAGTPAAEAGLVIGDILLKFAGERVRHPAQLAALFDEDTIGKSFPVVLARAGQLTELSVTVGERP